MGVFKVCQLFYLVEFTAKLARKFLLAGYIFVNEITRSTGMYVF